jgi:hypothetical protein
MRSFGWLGLAVTLAAGCSSGSATGVDGGGGAGTGGAAGGGGAAGMGGGAGGQTGGHTNPLSQALIDQFVAAHNQARSGSLNPPPAPALPPVTWDAVLADSAYNYLKLCASTGGSLVDHNANRSSDYVALGGSGYVGENIYATTGNTAPPADAVNAWMGEASMYDYATNTGDAGHYTQVVWRTSVRIGCAIVDCPAVQFHDTVLCDYAPGGNIVGQKPY